MAEHIIEKLKEYTGVQVGSRKVSSWCGKVSATYESQKGHGQLVINIGDVKIGEDCEEQIDNHLRSFIEVFERLQAEREALAEAKKCIEE